MGRLAAVSLLEDHGEERAPEPAPPARAKRALILLSLLGGGASAASFLVWGAPGGTHALESPFLWAGIAAFWAGAFCTVYFFEVRGVERAVARAGALEVTGLRVLWLPDPSARMVGASVEVRVRSNDPVFPAEFALFLNIDLAWALHVLALRASWDCRESGVLLLTPHASRFLGGATADSLELPSPEVAAFKALLKRPAEPGGLPAWGAAAGPLAREALAAVGASDWLLGPEQPFVALEAFGGRIEKTWPPIAERLVLLDVEGALDLMRIIRAFDRDALAARAARLTSSPPSPSSPPP